MVGLGGLMAPAANAKAVTPSSTQVALVTQVSGDRINASTRGIQYLPGAVLELSDQNGVDVATCTSDADGDCTFLVEVASMPNTAKVTYYARTLTPPPGWVDVTLDKSVSFTFDRPTTGYKGYGSTGPMVMQRPNPTLPATCGQNALKVAFVADLSGSMDDPIGAPAINVMKTVAKGYVDALATTDAQIALFTFSDHSPASSGANDNHVLTPAASGAEQLKYWINGWTAGGYTNYDEALWKVASYPVTFDFVIFLTDGVPTVATNSTNLMLESVASANAVKAKGIRIIAVGVGPELTSVPYNFIGGITGPKTGFANPASNDYFMASDWASVGGIFHGLANVCSGSTVGVTYVDDDAAGAEVAPVDGFEPVLTGMPGDTLTFGRTEAEQGFDDSKYEFVSMDDITEFTADPQTLTVHLRHVKLDADVPVTRTIHYVGAPTSLPDSVSTITWTKTTDQVTSTSVCTTTSTEYPAVTSPLVATYTADHLVMPAIAVTSPAAVCPPANIVETVTYTKIPDGTVQVVFFDVDSQAPVEPVAGFQTSFTGQPGEAVGFTEALARTGFDTSKYEYVSMVNAPTFTADPQTITVRVQHKITALASTTSRTIHYVGAGSMDDAVSVVQWAGSRDEATGVSVCMTSDAGYPAVTSPVVRGYTVDPAVVDAVAAESPQVTCPTQNTTVTVTYTKIPDGTVQVVFFDVDSQTAVTPVAGFQTSLAGLPGEDVGFTEAMAKTGFDTSKYAFVSMDDVPVFTADPQTLTVRVQHVTGAANVSVTRTIHYVGTPTPVADSVTTVVWTKTTDQVTSTSVCTTTSTGYPAVTSPLVATYTADHLVMPAIAVTSPAAVCPPANIVETVTYTKIPDGTVQVVFFDVDSQLPVAPVDGFQTSFAGQPGTAVGFTQAMATTGFDTSKYEYVSMVNAPTFTVAPQTITVRLQHKITDLQSTTSRTIHYVGGGSMDDVVSVVQWAGTRDEATGVSVCMTSDAGYPAVTSPAVYGYTVDPAVVKAVAAVSPQVTCPTQNSTVTVTYTRIPDGTVQVVFFDVDSQTAVTPVAGFQTSLAGLPGEDVGFTQAMAKTGFDASKYAFVSMDDVPVFTADPQTLTVRLTHVTGAVNVPVTRTIHYVGTPTPVADSVTTVVWTKTTDQVTSTSVCTTTSTGYPAVTSPVVEGYTADHVVMPAVPVTSPAAACPPENIVDTVTYAKIPDGSVQVVLVDDTTGAPVDPVAGLPTVLSGLPGTPVGFTQDDAMARVDTDKYVFVSVENVDQFPVDIATITIHVTHLMVPYKLPIDRIVHYVGAGTIPDAVSTVTWSRTVDAATLDEVCTTTDAGYPAVTSPSVEGYTADQAVVPALPVTSPAATCPTKNIEVTVTYTENPVDPVVIQTGGTTAGPTTVPVAAWILCLLGVGAAFYGIRRWVTGR
ncbi:MAG: VWA domain-containing protein [Propionibacteriaceae bacterium]|nr:VWA domain-containing protein [Propionibacteriaceae bacterium]